MFRQSRARVKQPLRTCHSMERHWKLNLGKIKGIGQIVEYLIEC